MCYTTLEGAVGKEKYNLFSSDDKSEMEFNNQKISIEQYDKRTPGKYKSEFEGRGIICLTSKLFHCWSDRYKKNGELITKTSCRGIQKKRNILVKNDFKKMLDEPKFEHYVENAGFIRDDLEIKTYTQKKKGLSYFYCKRKVLSDGVSTTHLDL